MCGILGVCRFGDENVSEELLERMADAVAHRGPDGAGVYTDGRVGLAHRRLAIVDLSESAAQPMKTQDGSYVIVYNGEVYNHLELRRELEALGHGFTTQSDTEVVLRAYAQWGEACVAKFNGMFAFALWDQAARRLFLARDRYGVKPLYYHATAKRVLFASEIKAFMAYPDFSVDVCYPALGEYFTFQNVFTDQTLFAGVRVLPPGCTLTLDVDEPTLRAPRKYWDYSFGDGPAPASLSEASDALREIFERAVVRQLRSDVPVGAYLSGGMDTGSIAAVASRQIRRLRTFTGGFDMSSASGLELGFDERPAAEALSNLYKTEHYEIILHAGDMEEVLPELVWHLEDLRVGQSYPNYCVARLAGKFVKVVLSGTGGDEMFAGYPWRYYRGSPAGPEEFIKGYYGYWQRLISDDQRASFFAPSADALIGDDTPFEAFCSVFGENLPEINGAEEAVNAALYFEAKTFLHGLLLLEDKLSMAHGLESRVPFLDNELVDFAMRVPPAFKLKDLGSAPFVDEDEAGKVRRYRSGPRSDGKVVLRQAMAPLVPSDVILRAKQGFSGPDGSWFRGESIDYVNRLLRNPKARIYDFLDRAAVARILDEHTSGQINHRLLIWSLLSFEHWCARFLP